MRKTSSINSAALGVCYFQIGEVFYENEDYANALEYFNKAAKQGNAGAQLYLGKMHAKGFGVKQSLIKAVKWYAKSGCNFL